MLPSPTSWLLAPISRRVVAVTRQCSSCAASKQETRRARRELEQMRAIANRYADDNAHLRDQLAAYEQRNINHRTVVTA